MTRRPLPQWGDPPKPKPAVLDIWYWIWLVAFVGTFVVVIHVGLGRA